MKLNRLFLALLAGLPLCTFAATPPPEKLLPNDTLALFTVPDWDKACAAGRAAPTSQMWSDPSMKPFVDKFLAKWKSDVITPVERELGIKLDDYADLIHGQFTFAVTQNGWTGQKDVQPGLLLIIDSKDKGAQLAKLLGDLKKKWTDSGKKLRSEKIRDVEFTTLLNAGDELGKSLQKAFPDAKPNADGGDKQAKGGLILGQSGSLLLVGSSAKDLEKVLIRQSGGLAPSLSEVPAYEANHSAMFRDANSYGWIHTKPIVENLKKLIAGDGAQDNPLGVSPAKVIDALGLGGLQTVAFQMSQLNDGTFGQLLIGVPEGVRKGLFKMLAFDAKESTPPTFIGADVVNFSRVRLDGQKLWATLEAMLNDASPQVGALLQMGIQNAGKDKDPNFDLKKQLIGNLGNDLIHYQKAPRSAKFADLTSPPALFLVGSPNPEQLVNAIKLGASLINPAPAKEREFLGRKVYSIALPTMPGADGAAGEKSLSYTSGAGYLVLSTDAGILEEYLRSAENKPKPLAEMAGLKEAAQKVGGMGTGWFGYDNESETLRLMFTALKQDPNYLEKLFAGPFGGALGAPTPPFAKNIKDWFDFSLLPPYEKIGRFFSYTVQSGSVNADGFSFKAFTPNPAK